MAEFRLRDAAQADLDEIWLYTRDNWSETQADKYLNEMFDALDALAEAPGRGLDASELTPGLRRFRFVSHVVFYFAADYGADVVRVLHSSRDFVNVLSNDL